MILMEQSLSLLNSLYTGGQGVFNLIDFVCNVVLDILKFLRSTCCISEIAGVQLLCGGEQVFPLREQEMENGIVSLISSAE